MIRTKDKEKEREMDGLREFFSSNKDDLKTFLHPKTGPSPYFYHRNSHLYLKDLAKRSEEWEETEVVIFRILNAPLFTLFRKIFSSLVAKCIEKGIYLHLEIIEPVQVKSRQLLPECENDATKASENQVLLNNQIISLRKMLKNLGYVEKETGHIEYPDYCKQKDQWYIEKTTLDLTNCSISIIGSKNILNGIFGGKMSNDLLCEIAYDIYADIPEYKILGFKSPQDIAKFLDSFGCLHGSTAKQELPIVNSKFED